MPIVMGQGGVGEKSKKRDVNQERAGTQATGVLQARWLCTRGFCVHVSDTERDDRAQARGAVRASGKA